MSLDIVGHAIVSADGRIADREHRMPPSLRSDADWRRFQAALDASALVVLGRRGHEAHPNPGRRRLVATSRADGLEPDPRDGRATLWNPAAVGFTEACDRLGIEAGTVAVTGGTEVFDLFLELYTRFDLVTAEAVEIPDGVPCFSGGEPTAVLAAAGLRVEGSEELEPGVRLEEWRR